jgi:hypothetical protein
LKVHSSFTHAASPTSHSAPADKDSSSWARKLFVCLWLFLFFFEGAYLWRLGNGLNYWADPHAEADTLRAAEGYVAEGLDANHLLPRLLYGHRFPNDGTVKDHLDSQGLVPSRFREDFPAEMTDPNKWVTTHCPPGADLINGLMARTFGVDPIWRLRLFPVTAGLFALAYFFRTIVRAWGVQCGALIAAAVVALPMVLLWLPSLHFQGYALSLVLVQSSLLIRQLWIRERQGFVFLPMLFLLGLIQGLLSWDHLFLVSLLALPWWLLRRAEGANPPFSGLFWAVVAPATGLALAHILHFWMAARELHGWQAAFGEFHRTAAERGGVGEGATGHLRYVLKSLYLYARWCFQPKHNTNFGPFFAMLLFVAIPTVIFSATEIKFSLRAANRRWQINLIWPGSRNPLVPLAGALLVSTIWLVAMPQHTVGNSHVTVHHLAILYICMAVIVARSLQFRAGERPLTIDSDGRSGDVSVFAGRPAF